MLPVNTHHPTTGEKNPGDNQNRASKPSATPTSLGQGLQMVHASTGNGLIKLKQPGDTSSASVIARSSYPIVNHSQQMSENCLQAYN